MRSNDCTKSSSDGSRHKRFCHPPTPLRCCSGRCLHQARSTCARSMAGKRSPPNQSISRLTSLLDQIASMCRRPRRINSNHTPDGTASGKVRITAQLIDAASDTHIWASTFERDMTDIFALQDDVTVAVVSAIEPKLLQTEIALAA